MIGRQAFPQYSYPRKNWSSLIIFNSEKCQSVYSYENVNTLAGLDLHTFKNLPEDQIGDLPKEFNYLVGETSQASSAKIAHFTNGMPYNEPGQGSEYSREWYEEFQCLNL